MPVVDCVGVLSIAVVVGATNLTFVAAGAPATDVVGIYVPTVGVPVAVPTWSWHFLVSLARKCGEGGL